MLLCGRSDSICGVRPSKRAVVVELGEVGRLQGKGLAIGVMRPVWELVDGVVVIFRMPGCGASTTDTSCWKSLSGTCAEGT
jgi:hypothetical protein